MSKRIIKTTDDLLYHKSMRLESTGVVIDITEAHGDRAAGVEIYHSPAVWKLWKNGHSTAVSLRDRQDLRDYITMLQDFDERFGHLIPLIQEGASDRNDDPKQVRNEDEHSNYTNQQDQSSDL